MSAFLDMVEADRDEVFLNLEEFGSEHNVDGSVISVVLIDEKLSDKDGTQALSDSTLTLYAKTEDLNGRKVSGETLYVDDVGYTVDTWLEEMGMTIIELTLPEGW